MININKQKIFLLGLFLIAFLTCSLGGFAFANAFEGIGNIELVARKNIEHKASMLFNGYPIKEIQKRTSTNI
jgi:hypothetical protein